MKRAFRRSSAAAANAAGVAVVGICAHTRSQRRNASATSSGAASREARGRGTNCARYGSRRKRPSGTRWFRWQDAQYVTRKVLHASCGIVTEMCRGQRPPPERFPSRRLVRDPAPIFACGGPCSVNAVPEFEVPRVRRHEYWALLRPSWRGGRRRMASSDFDRCLRRRTKHGRPTFARHRAATIATQSRS